MQFHLLNAEQQESSIRELCEITADIMNIVLTHQLSIISITSNLGKMMDIISKKKELEIYSFSFLYKFVDYFKKLELEKEEENLMHLVEKTGKELLGIFTQNLQFSFNKLFEAIERILDLDEDPPETAILTLCKSIL